MAEDQTTTADRLQTRETMLRGLMRQKPKGWWQCTNCNNVEMREREVMCWRCGKGEMVYVSR